jgi:hypothetical protein
MINSIAIILLAISQIVTAYSIYKLREKLLESDCKIACLIDARNKDIADKSESEYKKIEEEIKKEINYNFEKLKSPVPEEQEQARKNLSELRKLLRDHVRYFYS